MRQVLTSKPLLALAVLLTLQTAGFWYASGTESVPVARPLRELPQQMGGWTGVEDTPVEEEVLKVLKADDTLSRSLVNHSTRESAQLFVAFFRSQRNGVAPHSPKNCLPGSGWAPERSGMIDVALPGQAEPLRVNRYLVARGDAKTVVLYWYQSHGRVVASEYMAKIYLVLDAIRYRRSDTSIVRVVVPAVNGQEDKAESAAVHFVQAAYPALIAQLPQ